MSEQGRSNAVIPLLFIILTPFALTFPLVSSMGKGFFGTPFNPALEHSGLVPGDHLSHIYRFSLITRDLADGRIPGLDPYAFALVGGSNDPPFGWLYAPLYGGIHAVFGDVVAYNALVFVSLILVGGFTYLWLRRVGFSPLQATMGALAFVVFPVGYARLTGTIKAFFFWLMPASLWAAERARSAPGKPSAFGWSAASGICVAILLSVVEPETGVYFLPLLILYFVGRTGGASWAGLGAGLAVATGYLVWFYLVVVAGTDAAYRPFDHVLAFSPPIQRLFSRVYPTTSEHFIYPGIAGIPAAYGVWRILKSDHPFGRKLFVAATPFVILGSLGPKAPLIGGLYRWAYDVFTPLQVVRTPSRLIFVLGPILAIGVAAAAAHLPKTTITSIRGWALAATIAALLVADARVVYYGTSRPLNPAFFLELRGVEGILDLPVTDGVDFRASAYNYRNTFLPVPMVGGVSPFVTLSAIRNFQPMVPLNQGNTSPDVIAAACRVGVTHVFMWADIYRAFNVPPGSEAVLVALRTNPSFSEIGSSQGIYVFRLKCPTST